ncbi:class I SAM-dependent methyltransferase [bacterium]|nr:MAG: class I SAM-dependent methyltransferase [bacterium]
MVKTVKIDETNIHYNTDEIARYYAVSRVKWEDFYPSERWIFEKVATPVRNMGRVLDVGCAVGGLGCALAERFSVTEYVGVDINEQAIEAANSRKSSYPVDLCRFACNDILEIDTLPIEYFDNVFSLSCADWNVLTKNIIQECWRYVKKEGHFILTLRLTPEASLCDISESFQYICFGDRVTDCMDGVEKAPYVVLNIHEALCMLSELDPKPTRIMAYGYWGNPSPTARTLYDRLCFAALAVKKGSHGKGHEEIEGEFHLPVDLLI